MQDYNLLSLLTGSHRLPFARVSTGGAESIHEVHERHKNQAKEKNGQGKGAAPALRWED